MLGLSLRIRCFALILLAGPLHAQCCQNSVAVIASLSGKDEVLTARGHETKAAAAFDWLAEGDTLEVAARSQAVVILGHGHRYQLAGGAKITVTGKAVPKIGGAVRELPALPPIPQPAPVVAGSAPTPAAVRIRGGEKMNDLYPAAGAVALPDKAILQYKAVPQAASYRITLEDEVGKVVWNTSTAATKISVPAGTLRAGAHYYWQVRAMRAGIEIGAGTEEFNTLSAADSLKREQFAQAARATGGDTMTLALLADVDLRLGLRAEACDELSTAMKESPGDPGLKRVAQPCEPTQGAK